MSGKNKIANGRCFLIHGMPVSTPQHVNKTQKHHVKQGVKIIAKFS